MSFADFLKQKKEEIWEATASKAADPIDFASVCPARYIAAAAETAVRRYEARIAWNCLFIISPIV